MDVNNDPLPNEIRSLVTKKGKKHPDFRIKVYTESQSKMKEFIKAVESIFHRHLENCKDHIEGIGKDFKEEFPKVTENPLEGPMELNEVWHMDFMANVLSNGRKTRVFNVMDDCNREALPWKWY